MLEKEIEVRVLDVVDALERADDRIVIAAVHAILSARLAEAQRRGNQRARMTEAVLHNAIVQVCYMAQNVFATDAEIAASNGVHPFDSSVKAKMWHEVTREMDKTMDRTVLLR